ncbi:MAG: tRNA threonylcarbamoyladenosine dehydratase [Acutalibacteraceae bacterium]|nr:tRNA threonylcarbamoyladenosine dehydratase [Acutalibacteraceae bacterium]
MTEEFSRTASVIGESALEKLNNSKVAVFGVGGVGGHAAEALVRAGVGSIDLIDFDMVSLSNINRQLIALHSTVGLKKIDVLKERLLDINPSLSINCFPVFYGEETQNEISLSEYDYIIDAIDSVQSKVLLIVNSQKANTPIISSMGAGNKLNPAEFEVADIYKTSVCPLAKIMRTNLKKQGVKKLKCVYSKEEPKVRTTPPGSMSFVPSVVGMIMASEVVKDIIK